ARHYTPSLGRFLTLDPLGFDLGPNFYTYVVNNPLNMADPAGLVPRALQACERCAVKFFHQPANNLTAQELSIILGTHLETVENLNQLPQTLNPLTAALQALLQRIVNTAVAGGAEAITLPDILTRSGTVV